MYTSSCIYNTYYSSKTLLALRHSYSHWGSADFLFTWPEQSYAKVQNVGRLVRFFEWCIYAYKVILQMLVCIQWFTCNPFSVGPEKLRLFSDLQLVSRTSRTSCHYHHCRVHHQVREWRTEMGGWLRWCVYTRKLYIYAVRCHVGQFLREHGSILPFTQQDLEKYNDHLTKMFFRSTNMRPHDAMVHLLQKHNRMELLRVQQTSGIVDI